MPCLPVFLPAVSNHLFKIGSTADISIIISKKFSHIGLSAARGGGFTSDVWLRHRKFYEKKPGIAHSIVELHFSQNWIRNHMV
jgi:hypothetical protein